MALERSGGCRPEDTALTKIFVGGLARETRRDGVRAHFEKFGEVKDAIVVADGITGRSRGYGFVTFKDAEAARKACEDPFPVIDGRRTNCNLASLGAKKNRPYTPSPHPVWEKRRLRSGPSSRLNPAFNRVAPPSLHIPQPGTWEARTYPTYQYPAYSYSLHTMGTTSFNLLSPSVLELLSTPSTPWPNNPGHNTLPEIRTLPRTLHTVLQATILINFDSEAAIAGRDSGAEEDKVQQHQRELTKNSLLDEDNRGITYNSHSSMESILQYLLGFTGSLGIVRLDLRLRQKGI